MSFTNSQFKFKIISFIEVIQDHNENGLYYNMFGTLSFLCNVYVNVAKNWFNYITCIALDQIIKARQYAILTLDSIIRV